MTRADLLLHLGVPTLEPATGVAHLAEAAYAAFGLDALSGRSAEVSAAREAAIHAAVDIPSRIAGALEVTTRCVQRALVERAPPDAHVRAVRLQLALRRERALPDAPFARDPLSARDPSAGQAAEA